MLPGLPSLLRLSYRPNCNGGTAPKGAPMRLTLSLTTATLFCAIAAAQAQAPSGPPPILRIYVEHIKPGKGAAHQKSEALFVRAFTKAKSPSHYIALESMTGSDEAWF